MATLDTGLTGMFPELINLQGDYAGLPELNPYKERLYKIRDTAWDAGFSSPPLSFSESNFVCEALSRKVQNLHDIAQGRIRTLEAKTEEKLKSMGDAGQRVFFASAASGLVTAGNAQSILHQIGKAIGTRSLNFAREILLQAKAMGKINGLEDSMEERFYSALGLPEVCAAIREWEEFLAEVRVYHDFAMDSSRRIASGQWGTLLRAAHGLAFTDPPAYNASMSRMMGRSFSSTLN